MDFELLNGLINRVGTLLQAGELLLHHHLSIQICKHEVNLSLELIHHHWHLRGAEDLLDLVHCPCPGGSALHVCRMNNIQLIQGTQILIGICTDCTLP